MTWHETNYFVSLFLLSSRVRKLLHSHLFFKSLFWTKDGLLVCTLCLLCQLLNIHYFLHHSRLKKKKETLWSSEKDWACKIFRNNPWSWDINPEEHFFFLKMGLKRKNNVPVGRRGIYQGVILSMHLHWKKHQTLKVVKTFSAEEVKEIAAELARLSGGIVLDIHEDNTIIMYRGKNYSQPPTEIMSPRVSLSRKKVLYCVFNLTSCGVLKFLLQF